MSEKDFYKYFNGNKSIDIKEIEIFEKENNSILSESYKRFLLKNNGGDFLQTSENIKNTLIEEISSIETFYRLEGKKEEDFILNKFGLLEIAIMFDSNYKIYLKVKENNFGKIYLYDIDFLVSDFDYNNIDKYYLPHQEFLELEEDYYFILLANDFQDLINAFEENLD